MRYRRNIFWSEELKCSHTVQGTALISLTPLFHQSILQKTRYRKKFWTKNENARILLRVQRCYLLLLFFIIATSRYVDIEESFLERKTKMLVYYSGYGICTDYTSVLLVRPPKIEILKKNFMDRKTKMLTHCYGHRVGTTDTFFLHVRPQEMEISEKKFFSRKAKIFLYSSGLPVGIVDTYLSPVRPPEIEISKTFLDRKIKMLTYCSSTALVQLTASFRLCDLQKSRY